MATRGLAGVTSLGQVTITAVDLAAALAFYDAVLGAVGLVRLDELVDEEEDSPHLEAVAWGSPDGTRLLWVVDGQLPTTGLHLRLSVQSRVEVETFYDAALQSGGRGRSAPRRWAVFRRGEFNAIVADPAGNLIEVVGPE